MTTEFVSPPPVNAPLARILSCASWISWFSKGTLSVMDQGLVSGSNFLLNVMLARWLSPEEYGAYALGFSIFLLITAVYQSLVLEPMAVLGPILFPDRLKCYLGALLRGQSMVVFVLAGILAGAAIVIGPLYGKATLGNTLAGLALAAPAIWLFWLVRGACYLRASLVIAVQGAALYSGLLLGGIALVHHLRTLNGFMAFLIMGAASAVVSAHLLRMLAPEWRTKGNPGPWEVACEHWRFGRWELARTGLDWAGENISYALTAAFLGMREVGELKAIITLFLPLSHVLTALRRLILPHLSSVSRGQGDFRTSVNTVHLLAFALGTTNYLVLLLFGDTVFRLVYGGKFMEVAWLLPWAAIAQVIATPINGFDMGLRALRSPAMVFTTSAAGATASTGLYIIGTRLYGLPGTIAASIGAGAIYTTITAFFYYRRIGRS